MTDTSWRIVVVEDEYDSAQMVSKILNYHGIEVHVARNGAECLALLNDVVPTIVVTDLAMPDMDGWETLAAIRANPQTSHIPVVAITAYHSVDVAEEAMGAGFDAYFSKPINPRSFVDDLAKLIMV
jgi:CheY-like chemotaxis protein